METAAEQQVSVVLSSHLIAGIERVCDYLIVLTASRVRLAGETGALLATHHQLSGPRRDPRTLPASWDLIEESHAGKQSTLLVRTSEPVLDPAWAVRPASLEDMVLAYMSQPGGTARADRTGPDRIMIRFAWTRFRTQALAGAGVLAIADAVLLVTGIQLNHAYDAAVAVAVCKQQGNCAHMFTYTFPSQRYLTAANALGAADLAAPGLIGMFWGAPLAAREFETGTIRLAWTQGVTRTRWLAAKLAITGAAAIAAGELFTLMVNWWSSPIHKANPGYSALTSGSFHTGVAPAGYAAFAFALGVTAGLLIRRTLPAMAVTLATFTAIIIAFPTWVRPRLIPPARTTSTLSLASIANMPGVRAFNGYLSLAPGPTAAPPGAWVISSSQLTTPDGRTSYSEPAGPCADPPSPAAAQACNNYIESLHLRQTVTYQPASRYWAFQRAEIAIYLAPASRPRPRRVQLLVDQPQPLHGTKHPVPPHPPADPGTPKHSATHTIPWYPWPASRIPAN